MKVSLRVDLSMTLFHSATMKELKINKTIEKSYDEQSAEYQKLCKDYEEIVGFDRESNTQKFDKELMDILAEDLKAVEKETIENIVSVIKRCYLNDTAGVINFAGYIINPKEFCAVRVDGFKTSINKK